MKLILKYQSLFLLLLLTNDLIAQNTVVWKQNYGTSKNEVANKIIPTRDENLLLIGFRQTQNNDLDILVTKLDLNGKLLWENTFGGNKTEIGYDAVELKNGNWIIVGSQQTATKGNEICLLEIDKLGAQISQHTYGGPYNELPKSVFLSDDQHIMVGGTQEIDPTTPSAMLMKIADNWDEEWTRNINEAKMTLDTSSKISNTQKKWNFNTIDHGESANVVIKTNENGYLMAGHSMTNANASLATDAWICKLDADGQKIWSKSFGPVGGDDLNGLFEDASGDIYVTGECYDKPSRKVSMWVLKFSAEGELLFENKFGEGNIFLGGASTVDEEENIWTVGSTFNSEKKWMKCDTISLNQQQKYLSEGWIIKETKNGRLLEYDYEKNDPTKLVEQIMVVQSDKVGKLLWKKLVEREKEERPLAVCNIKNKGTFVTGYTYNGNGMKDIFVLKIVSMYP